ncbi:MAG: Hpt domain-containing protein [Herpetosiphonaceae bacterium]|nr:Hpt domain-containing protein [Herpetosiphonaceae bacterium]
MMDVNLVALLDEFRAEMAEYLQVLNTQLLMWERTPSDLTPIREMFLAAHTLKGAAAMMEIKDIVELTHAFEDVLALFRTEQRQLDGTTADLLFRTLDMLHDLVERAVPSTIEVNAAVGALINELREQQTVLAQAAIDVNLRQTSPDRSLRILLVEHSSTVRMLEEMVLNDCGFEVNVVADGSQAFSLVLQSHYDVVISGVETLGLRGLELAAALRNVPRGQDVPIILMSSDHHPEHHPRATELGVEACLRPASLADQELGKLAHSLVARGRGSR